MTICHLNKFVSTSFFEVSLVAHEVVDIVAFAQKTFLTISTETTVVRSVFTFCHNGAVEHCKEEVLKNETVVFTFFRIIEQVLTVVRIKLFDEMLFDVPLVKEFFRN